MKTLKLNALSEVVRPQAEQALNPETRREILMMAASLVRNTIKDTEQTGKQKH
jgi:hypothetical protein